MLIYMVARAICLGVGQSFLPETGACFGVAVSISKTEGMVASYFLGAAMQPRSVASKEVDTYQ